MGRRRRRIREQMRPSRATDRAEHLARAHELLGEVALAVHEAQHCAPAGNGHQHPHPQHRDQKVSKGLQNHLATQ